MNTTDIYAEGRSIGDFSPLFPLEEMLLDCVKKGNSCIISEQRPARGEQAENTVRAIFLRFLALGGDTCNPVHERGVFLKGAYITGNLDLQGCKNVYPLFLECCRIDGVVIVRDARTQTINLDGSRIEGLDAKRAKINGSIYLRHEKHSENDLNVAFPFRSDRGVNLIDASISGSFECHHAQFGIYKDAAIHASRVKIRGSVFLHQSFSAEGPIYFRGATIGGNFECSGGAFNSIENSSNIALDCHGSKIGGSVYFKRFEAGGEKIPFRSKGQVRFVDAEIGGSFECHGASMRNPDGEALCCSRMKVNGTIFIHEGFSAHGSVIFRGAEIGANFQCDGGTFTGDLSKEIPAIDCHGAQIGGSVFLRHMEETASPSEYRRFFASGGVRFIDAQVGGSFECHHAVMECKNGIALYCSRAKIKGSVLLYTGFESYGEISFRRADIGGNLDASDCRLDNEGRKTLSCENVHVGGSVLLKEKFQSHGAVNFAGADVEGDFDCDGGQFLTRRGMALVCERVRINGKVSAGANFRAEGEVNFAGAVIEGDFDCDGGQFLTRGGTALACERVGINGKVSAGANFRAEGEVNFASAVIEGKFGCSAGHFINPRPRSGSGSDDCANALTLRSAVIRGELWFGAATDKRYSKSAVIQGSLDLRDCQAGILTDDEASWPVSQVETDATWCGAGLQPTDAVSGSAAGRALNCFIYLNGFTYGHFGGRSPLKAPARKKWLERQPPADLGHDTDRQGNNFKTQPFEQLVKVLRETGNSRAARAIAMAKLATRLRRHHNKGTWLRRPSNWLKWLAVEKAVGYGYRWQRVVVAMFLIWIMCGAFYFWSNRQGWLCDDTEGRGACVARQDMPQLADLGVFTFSLQKIMVAPQVILANFIIPRLKILPKDAGGLHRDTHTPNNPVVEGVIVFEELSSWVASFLLLAVMLGVVKQE